VPRATCISRDERKEHGHAMYIRPQRAVAAVDRRLPILLLPLLLCAFAPAWAQVGVLTQHNDNSRTGANLSEIVLTTSNVNVSQFGKIFTRAVDSEIHAQILYVPNVTVPNKGTHNVIYAATEHNSVYAFDADSPAASAPLWQVNLGPSVPGSAIAMPWVTEVGIMSTPVIDAATGTLYAVADTSVSGVPTFRLHALDISTGAEKFGGPVTVAGSVPGTGYDSAGGRVTFSAVNQLNRPALLLAGNNITLAFGSHSDHDPYHGWIFAYNRSTLAPTAIWCSSPNSRQGAVWQSGQGPVADGGGNISVTTGNGAFDANTGGSSMGDSLVKLSPGLVVLDWFTPYDQDVLDSQDMDLGSGGVTAIPGTDLLATGGKASKLYIVRNSSLGHFHAGSDSQIVQSFQIVVGTPSAPDSIHAIITWSTPATGRLIYLWADNDVLKSYQLTGGVFNPTPFARGSVAVGGFADAGLSISASGSTAGTGILWAAHPDSSGGILRAYNAANVGVELWNSRQNAARDALGGNARFNCPTVANGKVYVPTSSNTLVAYGLLGASAPAAPAGLTIAGGNQQLALKWTAAPGASSYNIYRGTAINAEGTAPYRTGIAASAYTDTGLTNGSIYYYRVSAAGAGGESPRSAEVSGIPEAKPKPATGGVIDTANPLASGLVLCCPINEGAGAASVKNLVSGTSATIPSGWKWITTTEGRTLSGSGTQPPINFTPGSVPTGNVTIYVIGKANNASFFTQEQDGLTSGGWGATLSNTGASLFTSAQVNVPITSVSGQLVHIGLTRSGNTNTVYVNGVVKAAKTDAGGALRTSSPHRWSIGGSTSASGTGINGWISYVCVWNRALSASEMQQLNANPYGLLK
jgi:hypothetical protein